jgi:hypothetical protein
VSKATGIVRGDTGAQRWQKMGKSLVWFENFANCLEREAFPHVGPIRRACLRFNRWETQPYTTRLRFDSDGRHAL